MRENVLIDILGSLHKIFLKMFCVSFNSFTFSASSIGIKYMEWLV